MDAEKLVSVYVKIRDAKAAKTKEMEDAIKELDDQLDAIEQELLEICKVTGQDGGKTSAGSFTRSIKTRYWTSDWESMYDFILDHEVPELLERRIAQSNFKEFLKDNPDLMPEGVNVESKYSITVRRSTK
jgi:predicted metal-dependent phosphotriesterase family hydrolase